MEEKMISTNFDKRMAETVVGCRKYVTANVRANTHSIDCVQPTLVACGIQNGR
jgi:hypothetical protein